MRVSSTGAAYALAVGCIANFQASPAWAFSPPSLAAPSTILSSCRACSAAATRNAPERPYETRARAWGGAGRGRATTATRMSSTDIESPFATPGMADMEEDEDMDALLPLTLENVETVLDEMRPYLMSDG